MSNSNRITVDQVPSPNYMIVSKCLGCNPNRVTPTIDQEFPTLESAKAFFQGMVALKRKGDNGYVIENGVHKFVDAEGDSHEYVFAIVEVSGSIAWDEFMEIDDTNTKFNELTKDIDLE